MHWRHIEIRNPLRPRTPTFFQSLLAKETAEKKAAEKEQKEIEKHRRKSLARLNRREALWPRLKRFVRKLAPGKFWEEMEVALAEAEYVGRNEAGEEIAHTGRDEAGEEKESQQETAGEEDGEGEESAMEEAAEEEWEGDWMAVLEDSENE